MPAKTKKPSKPSPSYVPEINTAGLYDIHTAAAFIKGTVWRLRTAIWHGEISYVKHGRGYLFREQDLLAFIEKNRHEATN